MEANIVGKSIPQIDAIEKATGRARFAGDIKLPGMLHGGILHSPLAHGRIVHVDASRALTLRGVKAVVTGADGPAKAYGPDIKDEHVLARDKVRYVGDEVAAVAAVDEETAAEALALIRVEYEELPPVLDPLGAMRPDAPLIHSVDRNIAIQYPIVRGEVESGLREASCVLERRFVTSAVHPAYIEPLSCVAAADASGDLTLYCGVQAPFRLRDTASDIFNLSPGRLRIIDTFCGGGFGGKMTDKPMVICALLAQRTGRPVAIHHDRREAFANAHGRAQMIIDLRMGAARDGTILAKQMRIIADNGAYTRIAAKVLEGAAIRVDSLYRFKNIQTEALLVYTNRPPTGNVRGLGSPQAHFAVESMLDMLAEELGIDPVEIRRRNAAQKGDRSVHGWAIRSCGLGECIDRASERARWIEKRTEAGKSGIGMGCAIHISGTRPMNYAGSGALVKVDLDGTVSVITGETDLGQGAPTALAQIAAEVLGARMEDVRVAPIDTAVSPNCAGAFASRVTFIGGNAVRLAAADARRQILAAASKKLEANGEDLDIRDSKVYVSGSPERCLTLAQVVRANLHRPGGELTVGFGSFDSDSEVIDPKTKYGNLSGAYSFAAHVAEVNVDVETGQVDVVNFVAAHDVGRAINPMAVEGQVEGSVSQGLGYALSEEMRYGDDGALLNPNLSDYAAPTSVDVPTPQTILVETGDPGGPFGAKGVGEIGLIGTAPAIANAIYDAVGVRITELPITAEKVFKALQGKSMEMAAHRDG